MLELRASFLLQGPFVKMEFRKSLDPVLAVIIGAFVNRNLFPPLYRINRFSDRLGST